MYKVARRIDVVVVVAGVGKSLFRLHRERGDNGRDSQKPKHSVPSLQAAEIGGVSLSVSAPFDPEPDSGVLVAQSGAHPLRRVLEPH